MILTAEIGDANALCKVAISAFTEDKYYHPKPEVAKGPPRHDDASAHRQWIEEKFYLKYVLGSCIVGECIIRLEGNYGEIEGLFVDSGYMNRGIGHELISHAFKALSEIKVWELETPDYATRNQTFYESLGFHPIQYLDPVQELGYGFIRYRRTSGTLARSGDSH